MKHSKQEMTVSLAAIDRFRSSLSARGRSDHTVKGYTTDLRMFLTELEETEIPLDEMEETAQNWLTGTRKLVAPKTTTRRITSLRAFARWAGIGPILMDYRAPTPAKSDPHPIPEGIAGVRTLIDAAPNNKQKALIALCGLLGCRVSEALAVKPSDIDLERMMLQIRGKGDVTRRVPISEEAWDILILPVMSAFTEGDRSVVDLTDRFARRVITDLGVKSNLRRAISSHDLRATFATAVYDSTLDIRVVQMLLGHSSVDTTQIYVGITDDKLAKAVVL